MGHIEILPLPNFFLILGGLLDQRLNHSFLLLGQFLKHLRDFALQVFNLSWHLLCLSVILLNEQIVLLLQLVVQLDYMLGVLPIFEDTYVPLDEFQFFFKLLIFVYELCVFVFQMLTLPVELSQVLPTVFWFRWLTYFLNFVCFCFLVRITFFKLLFDDALLNFCESSFSGIILDLWQQLVI